MGCQDATALRIIDTCTACPADCIVVNPEFEETPEQLQEKYNAPHG